MDLWLIVELFSLLFRLYFECVLMLMLVVLVLSDIFLDSIEFFDLRKLIYRADYYILLDSRATTL